LGGAGILVCAASRSTPHSAMIGKRGPTPASVAEIHPRHDLELDVVFAVRGRTVRLTLHHRSGKEFMRYNTVGSAGLLTWKRRKVLDWLPLPASQSTGMSAPAGSAFATGGARVFVSYPLDAAEDAAWVARAFQAAGVPVWIDETNLAPGDSLPASIEEGIKSATVFVPLIDDAWIASEWCVTELKIARINGVRVVPMRIDHGRFNVPPDVRQALRAVGEPLTVNLRRADANQRLMDLASELAGT
jgi:hypothetical protein